MRAFLCREMSHFLLNAWFLQDHPELDAAKRAAYTGPCVDALVLNEHLYYDPSIDLDRSFFLNAILDNNPLFRRLSESNLVSPLPIPPAEYDALRELAVKDTVTFVSNLLNQRKRRRYYNYAHLLESPLSFFVQESDQLLTSVRNASSGIKNSWNYLRGVVPFIYSSCLCWNVYKETGIPFVASRLSQPFIDELATNEFQEQIPVLASASRQAIDALIRERNMEINATFSVDTIGFDAICGHHAASSKDAIENALSLRIQTNCKHFRKAFWRIIETAREDPQRSPSDIAREEYRNAKDAILGSAAPDVLKRLKSFVVQTMINVPISLVLDPIASLLTSIGVTATTETIALSAQRARYGWFYFIYNNLELPKPDIGAE
jgi:hypothetical protein